jgi:L-threonylcarbamoyladenylate synthase
LTFSRGIMMQKRLRLIESGAKDKIVKTLRDGGVVILPTDTIYGFSTPLSSESGIRRIAAIKGNGEERKFLFLAASVAMVERYIHSWGCTDRPLMEDIWPAPLTAVLPAGKICPVWVGETIALRVPAYQPLTDVIQKLGEPIISTSVNRSSEPPLRNIDLIERIYQHQVDLVVEGGAPVEHVSSTVVDFTGEMPMLVRQGEYYWDNDEGDLSKS